MTKTPWVPVPCMGCTSWHDMTRCQLGSRGKLASTDEPCIFRMAAGTIILASAVNRPCIRSPASILPLPSMVPG